MEGDSLIVDGGKSEITNEILGSVVRVPLSPRDSLGPNHALLFNGRGQFVRLWRDAYCPVTQLL